MTTGRESASGKGVDTYNYADAGALMRPDGETRAQFRENKPPKTYRYDSSLDPGLEWNGGSARRRGNALIRQILGVMVERELP